ncbi:MAG: ABC transporter permease [Candidatus Latescibacterota bacterium]
MQRVWEMVRKEFLQLRRDPRMLSILLTAPVIQLTLLGYAATTDLTEAPVVVCDLDRSSASRRLVDAFTASGDLRVIAWVESPGELDGYLAGDRADLGLVIPRGFAQDLRTGQEAAVQVLVDGTKVTATVAMGELVGAVGQHAALLAQERLRVRGLSLDLPQVGLQTRVWYNPELSSRLFMVPGVLALVLMVITTVATSMAVVRERETGTIEQIVVTPLRPVQLILGKLLPFAAVGLLEVLLVLSVALFWFGIPLRGSLGLLLVLAVLFMVTSQALGLLVSTVSRTQQQAMMTSVFFVMMPMMLLSGFVFPIENMPREVQYVTYLLPLRYFLVILRGIFLKGVGWAVLWPEVVSLAVFTAGLLLLAVSRFHKRLA